MKALDNTKGKWVIFFHPKLTEGGSWGEQGNNVINIGYVPTLIQSWEPLE